MSGATEILYANLKATGAAEVSVTGLVQGDMKIMAADLYAAMIPPIPLSPWANLPYISQWASEANARQNDCGFACIAMFMRALGDLITVNQLRSNDPTGLSDAAELQATLKVHGIDSAIERKSPAQPLADAVAPYTMLLMNYGPIAPYSLDKYSGWHWLIYLGPDPKNPANSLVNDPDYWTPYTEQGNHKSLPTSALRAAFKPYPGNPTTTALRPIYAPLPQPEPHTPGAERLLITSQKNIRKLPDPASALVKTLYAGSEAWVIGAKTVTGYRQMEDGSGYLYVQGI